ncbi:MAG: thiamine phosphate synthase [Bacillota bacterium]
MNFYRMIDANINRVSEGIRVLEDISRFVIENQRITKELRELRHRVRKSFVSENLIQHRDSGNDVGFEISSTSTLDKKENPKDLIASNFKRVQEGLRSIEECLKVVGHYRESKIYEQLRYKVYDIEKAFQVNKAFLDTDIYGITCEALSAGRNNLEVVRQMMAAGIQVIQYREKSKSKLEKYKECETIRRMTRDEGVLFIVNDDIDIALCVEADGIHLGQDDIPVDEARRIAGNMIIGLSTHNSHQALNAVEMRVDYIGVGPVFPTTTKKNPEPSEGLAYLQWVSKHISIPYVAIGGINEENISQAKAHGGKCFALISDIVGAPSIEDKVKMLRKVLNINV